MAPFTSDLEIERIGLWPIGPDPCCSRWPRDEPGWSRTCGRCRSHLEHNGAAGGVGGTGCSGAKGVARASGPSSCCMAWPPRRLYGPACAACSISGAWGNGLRRTLVGTAARIPIHATVLVWFGVEVRGVVGLGPKIHWPEADIRAAHELATRAVRLYATSEEAWSRYRRVSGLEQQIAPDEEWLQRGISQDEQGWRLSSDPRTYEVAGAPFASLAASAHTRILLARGEHDPMVSSADLRLHTEDTYEIRGAGHNAHVEKPDEVVGLLAGLLR